METKVDSCNLERIKRRCGFDDGLCLSSNGKAGGIGFWWRDVGISTISYSVHHFAIDVLNSVGVPIWRAIGVYGWPKTENKHKTWEMMINLHSECNIPCIMFGDFKKIVSMNEKDGGAVRRERLMDAFREAIDMCGLRDLGFSGNIFTWQRGTTSDAMVRERLDRFLAEDTWCNIFPNFIVSHLPMQNSGHAPILQDANKVFER
uniref:Endonuclease/exonuclease/phosphatase domain-containing protein n=1 Tax=Chenopodium quinoa TaxID=63459 RepID=A0A803MIJ2_CHEQI